MDNYVTGNTVKELREKRRMTQKELADCLGVSDKCISKWETGRGLPDISLIEPLAKALGISIVELLSGDYISNENISSNMLRSKLYVCPICGNVIHTMGEGLISCCGVTLPVLEAEEADAVHEMQVERIENEYFVKTAHEMKKEHYISFFALATSDKFMMIKLYPEQNAEVRFPIVGHGILYAYCNKHGLIKQKI